MKTFNLEPGKEKKYYDIILKRVEAFNKNPKQLTLFENKM